MWQVRRCLNILQRASKEEIEDLFSTSSEVQKMNGMVQTLQIMLGAIEARKAVVEEREVDLQVKVRSTGQKQSV